MLENSLAAVVAAGAPGIVVVGLAQGRPARVRYLRFQVQGLKFEV